MTLNMMHIIFVIVFAFFMSLGQTFGNGELSSGVVWCVETNVATVLC